jgi:membrane protein DedA with SNARE-associated domain
MFHSLVTHIEPLLQTYGALGVFLASIIEEIIAPIPSTIVVFTSGVLLTQGLHGWDAIFTILFKIMIPAAAGITIGSLVPYFIARIGEKVAIDKLGKYVGLNWSMVEKMQARAEKGHSIELVIFITRAIPGIPSLAVSVFCGLARVPFWKYVIWSFIGCLPRNFILGLVGWLGGTQYGAIMEIVSSMESGVLVIIFAVAISLGIGWFLFQHRRKKHHTKSTQ